MKFHQYYLECLSQASYLIGDEASGRAVVVDPRRDIDEYLEDATSAGMTIEMIIETHFHADFLSGHLELAQATGAEIAYGAAAEAEYPIRKLHDGERIELGDIVLEILATPGHTPESISIVVYEHRDDEVPYGVLTGDTLFIGDVGRPDLLTSVGVTAEELAGQLYESVHGRLALLDPATRVFPAHGAGSACGKNLSTETQSTIGEQLTTNYAMAPTTRDAFIEVVTEGQLAAPQYFAFNAAMNKEERDLLDMKEGPEDLSIDQVIATREEGGVVLDTRDPAAFAAGHIIGSVNVGLDGRFAEYAGSVIPPRSPIALVCEPGTETEAKMRLGRIGYDMVVGALSHPYWAMAEHEIHVERSSRLTAEEFRSIRAAGTEPVVVDVRGPGEHRLGAVDGAVNIPLAELVQRIDELDPSAPTVVYCAGGYRSSIASSTLGAAGFLDVSDILGGYAAVVDIT